MKRASKNSENKKGDKKRVPSNSLENFDLNEMKTNRLEDFVKANRDAFDFREPSSEVWDKIATNTQKPKVVVLRQYFMRVAAVLVVAIISTVLVWQSDLFTNQQLAETINDPELMELIEAEAFYSHQVDKKLKEIQKCYYTHPEIKAEIESDLHELEGMYKVLKTDLQDNISNKNVIEAMIENNRFRLALCDDVLEQINC